jgi:hypothetical protein
VALFSVCLFLEARLALASYRPFDGIKGGIPQRFTVVPTEFEMLVKRIELTKSEYIAATEFRLWCERSRDRVYVPEWLLEAWGFQVEAIISGVASPASKTLS